MQTKVDRDQPQRNRFALVRRECGSVCAYHCADRQPQRTFTEEQQSCIIVINVIIAMHFVHNHFCQDMIKQAILKLIQMFI